MLARPTSTPSAWAIAWVRPGLLVPPKDVTALAQGIVFLIQNEKEAAAMAGRAAEEGRQYNLPAYVRRLEQVYSEVVEGKRERRHTIS